MKDAIFLQELILQNGSKFLSDPAPEVRKHARSLMTPIVRHVRFDALQQSALDERTRRDIKKAVESLQVNGPG